MSGNAVHHVACLHCGDVHGAMAAKEAEATVMTEVVEVPVHSACCSGVVSTPDVRHFLEVHTSSCHQQGRVRDILNLHDWNLCLLWLYAVDEAEVDAGDGVRVARSHAVLAHATSAYRDAAGARGAFHAP